MQADVWMYNGVEFKVGDRVKVVSDAESLDPNGMGVGVKWENTWAGSCGEYLHMDGYIGLEFEIADISELGVFFSDDFTFGFPLSCMINLSQRDSLPVIQQKEAA